MNKRDRREIPSYIPPELKRRPIYRRLPPWVRRPVDSIGESASRVSARIHARLLRVPLWLNLALCAGVGLGAGAAVMRQRRAARDVILAVAGATISAPELRHRLEIASGTDVVDELITEALLRQLARDEHLAPSEADIQTRIKVLTAMPLFLPEMRRRMMDAGDIHELAELQLVRERLYGRHVSVTNAEIQAYYRQMSDPANPQARFYTPDTVQVDVIRTRDEAAIRQAARELRNGADFAQVSRKVNKAAPGQAAFRIGGSPVSADPAFEKRIYHLQPGQQAGPERSLGAWWIVRCASRAPAIPLPFEQVRDACLREVSLQKGMRRNGGELARKLQITKARTPIHIYWPGVSRQEIGGREELPPNTP